jgi:hypothetical protein
VKGAKSNRRLLRITATSARDSTAKEKRKIKMKIKMRKRIKSKIKSKSRIGTAAPPSLWS